MLDFRSGRQAPPPGFTLDRKQMALARGRGLKRREWRLLVTLPLAAGILVLAVQYLIGLRIPTGEVEQFPTEVRLAPMPRPDLGAAAALPAPDAVTAAAPLVQGLMADRATVRHATALDAATLAWAGLLAAQDRLAPPPPQRVEAAELVLGAIPAGSAVLIDGRLEDARSDGAWERLLVAVDGDQFLHVLAAPEARTLAIGSRIRLVGRHLGDTVLPGTDGPVTLPLLLATGAGKVLDAEVDRSPYRGVVRLPADRWEGISDERLAVEQRPYFYTLGQVAGDLALGSADGTPPPNANAQANDIHQHPDRYRGLPFTVIGYVYRAWEDPEVAAERPWGIGRVVRVLLWSRDFGAVTEWVDGKPRVRTQILRLYELAMITDQPLPKRMDRITASGRFIKFHALAVDIDPARDRRLGVDRQSNRAYAYLFATGPYTVLTPPPIYEFGPWTVVAVTVATALVALVWIMWRKDAQAAAALEPRVREMRAQRRALRRRQPAVDATRREPLP